MPFSRKVLAEVLNGLGRVAAEGDGETLHRLYLVLAAKKANDKKQVRPTEKKPSETSTPAQLFDSDDSLREQLYAFESRDALANFVEERFPRKADIVAVSRIVKVAVNKNDDYEAMLDRLIDATIGYKLRSRAIRGDG